MFLVPGDLSLDYEIARQIPRTWRTIDISFTTIRSTLRLTIAFQCLDSFWHSSPCPKISCWDDMEVPEESFHWSSWDSRTCYPRRAFIQGLTDDCLSSLSDHRLTNKCSPEKITGEINPRELSLEFDAWNCLLLLSNFSREPFLFLGSRGLESQEEDSCI